jgi:hypothetical protein
MAWRVRASALLGGRRYARVLRRAGEKAAVLRLESRGGIQRRTATSLVLSCHVLSGVIDAGARALNTMHGAVTRRHATYLARSDTLSFPLLCRPLAIARAQDMTRVNSDNVGWTDEYDKQNLCSVSPLPRW